MFGFGWDKHGSSGVGFLRPHLESPGFGAVYQSTRASAEDTTKHVLGVPSYGTHGYDDWALMGHR